MAAGAPLLPLEPPRAGLPQPPCPARGRSSSQLAVPAFSPLSACCGGLRCFWQAGLACNNFWPLVGSYNSSVVKYKLAENRVLPSAAGRLRRKGGSLLSFPAFVFPPSAKGHGPPPPAREREWAGLIKRGIQFVLGKGTAPGAGGEQSTACALRNGVCCPRSLPRGSGGHVGAGQRPWHDLGWMNPSAENLRVTCPRS